MNNRARASGLPLRLEHNALYGRLTICGDDLNVLSRFRGRFSSCGPTLRFLFCFCVSRSFCGESRLWCNLRIAYDFAPSVGGDCLCASHPFCGECRLWCDLRSVYDFAPSVGGDDDLCAFGRVWCHIGSDGPASHFAPRIRVSRPLWRVEFVA